MPKPCPTHVPITATINGRSLELVLGDITQQQVDVIVNAANSRLAGGGGVDGAIHRAGGHTIMDETRRRLPRGLPNRLGCHHVRRQSQGKVCDPRRRARVEWRQSG